MDQRDLDYHLFHRRADFIREAEKQRQVQRSKQGMKQKTPTRLLMLLGIPHWF